MEPATDLNHLETARSLFPQSISVSTQVLTDAPGQEEKSSKKEKAQEQKKKKTNQKQPKNPQQNQQPMRRSREKRKREMHTAAIQRVVVEHLCILK